MVQVTSNTSETETLLQELVQAVEELTLEIRELRNRGRNQEEEQEAQRPLRVGDRVRITSCQLFGTEGIIHSFTTLRVRVRVEGRRQLVLRAQGNLERVIPVNQAQ